MKKLVAFLFISLAFVACTDYEADYEDTYGNLLVTYDDASEYDASANTLTDLRDGQTYKTVTIGIQTWMAENLNFAYNEKTSSLDSSSFCYGNSADSCSKYGRLYLWSAAMDSSAVFSTDGKGCGYGATCSAGDTVRGVCPEGWHLPNSEEWNTLFTAVGGTSTAGSKLKYTSGWNNSGNGEDSYSFSVLSAGDRNYHGYFYCAGYYAYIWNSAEGDSYSAYAWLFDYESAYVGKGSYRKDYGFSVRCVRNYGDEGSDASLSSSSSGSDSRSSKISSSSMEIMWNYLNPNISYGEMTDSRDGLVYKTVTIGSQTWMAENLNYAYNEKTLSLDSSSFCYNNSADSCSKYGRLYLWSAAMDSAAVFSADGRGCGYGVTCNASGTVRGVCPEGWHLPSVDEWNTLFTTVGDTSIAGTVLKSANGWYNSCNGENSYGFSALPAGYRNNYEHFYSAGYNASFWSYTEYLSDLAYSWLFSCSRADVNEGEGYKYYSFSVRCVRNSDDEVSVSSSSSSSGENESSSSSIAESSSGILAESSSSSISQSTYDCSKYSCVTTDYLNQEMLAAGKYGELIDDRDGQIYRTIQIGNQVWMAQNLNFAYLAKTSKLDSSSFCYDNENSNCSKYGRLYLWSAVMDSSAILNTDGKGCGYGKTCSTATNVQGVCPSGWHIPHNSEWITLFEYLGGESEAAEQLKASTDWTTSLLGSNSTGFSILPAGSRNESGSFIQLSEETALWSSDENDQSVTYIWYCNETLVYAYGKNKINSYPVRCIQD